MEISGNEENLLRLLKESDFPAEHLHCLNCFKWECDYDGSKCEQVLCPFCKTRLHGCKLEDHQLCCSQIAVPCPNAYYGCERQMKRCFVAGHLPKCPASVVHCAFVRNRRFVSELAKKKIKLVAKEISPKIAVTNIAEIDEKLAEKDQLFLEHYFQTPRPVRKKIGLPISERALLDYDLNDDAQHKFVNGVNFSKAETSAQSERINPDPAGDSSDEEERTEAVQCVGAIEVFEPGMWDEWCPEWESHPDSCPYDGPYGMNLSACVARLSRRYTYMRCLGVVDVFGAEMWAVWRAEWETDPGACPFLGPFGIRLVDLVDTFAEKYTGMKIRIKKTKEPFAGCHLCKLSPGSQHLHVLGRMLAKGGGDDEAAANGASFQQRLLKTRDLDFLPPFYRERGLLVHTEIPYAGLVHEGLSRHKQKTKELNQPLICERSVRRDEFHDHYQYHIYAECTPFLGRCPLKWKGCDFTVQEALRPAQGRFRFNDFLGTCVHEPCPHLPALPLMNFPAAVQNSLELHRRAPDQLLRLLGPRLDGATLGCLAATNSRLRARCRRVFADRMVVEPRWHRLPPPVEGKPDGPGESGRDVKARFQFALSRRFGDVQRGLSPRALGLSVHSLGAIADHLQHCPFNVRKELEPDTQRVQVMPLSSWDWWHSAAVAGNGRLSWPEEVPSTSSSSSTTATGGGIPCSPADAVLVVSQPSELVQEMVLELFPGLQLPFPPPPLPSHHGEEDEDGVHQQQQQGGSIGDGEEDDDGETDQGEDGEEEYDVVDAM